MDSQLQPVASPIPREVVSFNGTESAGHDHRPHQASGGSIWSCPTIRRCDTASASAVPASPGRASTRIANKREWPDWTPPAADAEAPSRPAAPYGRRHRQSARRARDVSRRHALSHPRLERARHDRPGGLLRLHPDDQRRRVDLYSRARVGARVSSRADPSLGDGKASRRYPADAFLSGGRATRYVANERPRASLRAASEPRWSIRSAGRSAISASR